MDQWDVARNGGICTTTGRELAEGEEHFAVLFEEGETFRREDYSLEAWEGPPPGAFCHFKTRVPVREKKKRLLVDDDLLVNFFTRLAEEEGESKANFRFVLALILLRKRILKYDQTERSDAGEVWIMRWARDKEADPQRVLNPQLNDTQIEQVSRELGAILHGDMGEFDETEDQDAATETVDEATGEETNANDGEPQAETEDATGENTVEATR